MRRPFASVTVLADITGTDAGVAGFGWVVVFLVVRVATLWCAVVVTRRLAVRVDVCACAFFLAVEDLGCVAALCFRVGVAVAED